MLYMLTVYLMCIVSIHFANAHFAILSSVDAMCLFCLLRLVSKDMVFVIDVHHKPLCVAHILNSCRHFTN